MISFPNAKINIGLNIVEKRPDGFHNLESIFVPVFGLHDILEVVISDKKKDYIFKNSGISVDGNAENNLVVKAYKLLKKDFNLPAVNIHLHKIIPFGAGLGGGSADASFMLKMLNNLFELNICKEKLLAYAEKLGSDCPFFIDNKIQFASQKGQILEEINFFIPKSQLVIVKPNIHIPTKDAFAKINPQKPQTTIKKISNLPLKEWKNIAKNDFEKSIFPKYPQISEIKEKLYKLGAEYASMTGSGSSVFGIFPQTIDLQNEFENYFTWQGQIKFP